MQQIIGLVLCGGKSSRMGRDKGLIPIGDTIWANRLKMCLHELSIKQVLISVSEQNYDNYLYHFQKEELIVDMPFDGAPTALRGLLTLSEIWGEPLQNTAVLVLACDLQLIDSSILNVLMKSYLAAISPKPHILSDGNFLQPLAGIYPFSTLKTLKKRLQTPTQQNQSIKKLISQFQPQIIEVKAPFKLTNFNTPEELEKFQSLLPKHKLH